MTIQVGGGGGGLPQLAPDLTFPSELFTNSGFKKITGIDATGSLTTLLNLVGKFEVRLLTIGSVLTESITIKLTVDDEIKWDDTFVSSSTTHNLMGSSNASNTVVDVIQCNESLKLELQTTTDTAVIFSYLVRPIL